VNLLSFSVLQSTTISINNHNFHNYVHLIYPDELEIKDTTESASYLDILLNIDSNGRLTTSLYGKRNDFDFAIVNKSMFCVWGLFKTRQTTY
jgi:hypothetical protein